MPLHSVFARRITRPDTRRLSLAAAAALAAALAACAQPPAAGLSPAGVAALEARAARDPADVRATVRLGEAYRDAGRLDAARRVLEGASQRAPRDGEAALFLGLTCEDQGDAACARAQYERFLRAPGGSQALKTRVRGRLAGLERCEMHDAVRALLAREAALAQTPPQPGTVAVFPFLVTADDPALRPLDRALAEFLATDLSQTDRLRVLERVRVQALADELKLAESGAVDPATAARSGRLLGAASVVQGRVAGSQAALRLDAAVAKVDRVLGDTGAAVAARSGALAGLFGMEKELAVDIYGRLGVRLTDEERARVLVRPTENLQAALAFGRGLQSADEGDFAEAVRHFLEAARLDPGFAMARAKARQAAAAARASGVTTEEIAAQARAERNAMWIAAVQSLVPAPGGRDAATEALGQEGFRGQTATIELVFPRP
ncbi:MAG TPA: CsgG/HfaB family protein [Longimicrobium sp.]